MQDEVGGWAARSTAHAGCSTLGKRLDSRPHGVLVLSALHPAIRGLIEQRITASLGSVAESKG
jgi:hypothetical protein